MIGNIRERMDRRFILQFIIGAVLGGCGVAALMELGLERMEGITGSHIIAGAIGVIYLVLGLFVAAGTFVPTMGEKLLNVEDADELREEKRPLMVGSVIVGAIGAALLSLVLTGPDGVASARFGAIAAVAFIVVLTLLALATRSMTDEMNRTVAKDALYAAYNLLFVVGGGWSALAYGGFVPVPGPLDWLSMLTGFGLLAIFWQVHRRGMGSRRY